MAEVSKTVLIEHTPAQMFELVDCCEDYPKFLPWCSGCELHHRDERLTVATLHINYHGLKSKFSTENSKKYPDEMTLRLKEGPFRHLDGLWRFTALGDNACKIEFRLSYQFSSRLLEKVLGRVFNHIANTFVESFVSRADVIYPKAP